MDFEVQRCTRRCHKTDREFQPDEVFYSTLSAEGAEVVRHDFCEEAWEGPPEGVLGWWKSRMPGRNANRVNWAPNDVMLEYFEQLEGDEAKCDVRYILALLLIRRRVVRLEDQEEDATTLVLYCPRRETTYRVATVNVSAEQTQKIQEELAQLLIADAA